MPGLSDATGRALVEQILAEYGLKPEALPNLYSLSPVPTETLWGGMRPAVRTMAGWRSIFPETVDSIVGLRQHPLLPNRQDPNWLASDAMQADASRLWGTAEDIAARGAPLDDPTLNLYNQAIWNEPAPPRFSQERFLGVLPHNAFADPAYQEILTNEDLKGMHPLAYRRLAADYSMLDRGVAATPRWGDKIVADTLVKRLRAEQPAAFEKLLNTIPLGQTQMYHHLGPGRNAEKELVRRISAIYSQDPYRFSSELERPNISLRTDQDSLKRLMREPPGISVYERMKQAEFKPTNKTPAENVFDELENLQKLKGEGRQIGNVWERALGKGVETARNPTNEKIQQILSESLGFGKGKMAGAADPALLTKVALPMIGWIAADKVASEIPNKHTRSLVKGALQGAGIGGLLGPEGALLGAGVGALAAQVF